VQPIRAGDAMKTKLKGIASAGDGDSNVFLYFLNQA
jgi:predicted RNA-binding protein with TRAM domain